MKSNLRRTVLLLCVFMGLFFLLQTDTTLDDRSIHSSSISVQSVQMVFRPVQVRRAVKVMVRAISLPAVYLPLHVLFEFREDYFLRALLTGIWLICFTIYSLRIIYKMDGKKRAKCVFYPKFCK